MINMSNVYGTVCIYAKRKKDAKKVLSIIHEKLKDDNYNMRIDKCKDGTLSAAYTGKEWITASSFERTERWIFEDNVQQLSEWLRESINELKPLDFRLEFEFNDYEPGCLNRYKTTITADHKANDPEIRFKTSKYECNEYVLNLEQPDTKEINQKEHTDEKQEKMENTQINNENEDDKKILESNQHNEGNNTLGTIIVPKKLEAGTYTLTKTKIPAEEKTIGDLILMMIGKTAAAVVIATIIMYGCLLFRLMYYFITSLF